MLQDSCAAVTGSRSDTGIPFVNLGNLAAIACESSFRFLMSPVSQNACNSN